MRSGILQKAFQHNGTKQLFNLYTEVSNFYRLVIIVATIANLRQNNTGCWLPYQTPLIDMRKQEWAVVGGYTQCAGAMDWFISGWGSELTQAHVEVGWNGTRDFLRCTVKPSHMCLMKTVVLTPVIAIGQWGNYMDKMNSATHTV